MKKELPSDPFFSRELSWIDFNERVLGEGLRKEMPPMERLKFLSIVSSNFDEFFMIRVAALKGAAGGSMDGPIDRIMDPSGHSPAELLRKINKKVRSILERQGEALLKEVFPGLAEGGLCIRRLGEWQDSHKDFLESYFIREIFPILTPLRLEEDEPLPSIDNYSLYAAFLLETGEDEQKQELFSIIRIPQSSERLIPLPTLPGSEGHDFALLEDLVQAYGAHLYPGYHVGESLIFKVNRDADFSVDEQRDEDFVEAMAEVLESRDKSKPVRMLFSCGNRKLRDFIAARLSLGEEDLYEKAFPLNLGELYDLLSSKGFDKLKEKSWKVYQHPAFSEDQSIWDSIRAEDIMLHLPYQSFDPVLRFFQEAAADPQVSAIKTALYRTSYDSPILRALEQASRAGKHVTAVVELKARFDEGRNISWANRLEKAGVIVVYGIARLKIHAKISMVMRREYDRIKRYVHLSTGNYNDKTAKLYEDISIFTAREDIAYDAGLLFNMITGYSAGQSMVKLRMAPSGMKRRILELIRREISRSSPESPGRIMAKMNSLADGEIIKALYKASQAGVKVSLNVRGVCTLVPGLPELSENIRVVSVIDHFLEHSRIYYFSNGGAEEIYLSSADWMTRNLERRVELMFPVLQDDLRKTVFEKLSAYFQDNRNAWLLDSDGLWSRIKREGGEVPFRVQAHFHSLAAKAQTERHSAAARGEFIVRRSPPVDIQGTVSD